MAILGVPTRFGNFVEQLPLANRQRDSRELATKGENLRQINHRLFSLGQMAKKLPALMPATPRPLVSFLQTRNLQRIAWRCSFTANLSSGSSIR
jgi:hypothetical protein